MNNKFALKTMLENIDKNFPNSAMLYGVDSTDENPLHVFVMLDDDFMYFGKQVPGTGEINVKKVDIDKILKVSFSENVLSVQIKDHLYELKIITEELGLRALCKEFKAIKTKDPSATGGDIMGCDFEEMHIEDTSFANLRVQHAPLVMPGAEPVQEEPMVPEEAPVEMPTLQQASPEPEDKFESSDDFLSSVLKDYKVKEEEVVLPKVEMPVTPANTVFVPSGKDAVNLTVQKEPLSKKEQKQLAKRQKKADKEERKMYQKSSNGFAIALMTLITVALLYLTVSYVLAMNHVIELPLHDLPMVVADYIQQFIDGLK